MGKLIIVAGIAILLFGGAWISIDQSATVDVTAQTQATAIATASPAALEQQPVVAEAKVMPAQSVELRFPAAGAVAEVLAQEGDQVAKGAPLARLETRALELAVQEAQARLSRANADYESLIEGASPEEIAAAQATLNQATAGLQSTQGSVTQKDIQAAQAKVETARARMQQLTNGPKATDRDAAQARVRESEANLQSQRDALSAAKTNAKLRMDQVVNELTQAQAAYVTAKQRRDHVEATGDAPISSASLNEAQKREFYDAYVASAAQLRTAEQTVAQAQVDFDTALQQRLKKRQQDTNVLFASRAAFGFDAADIAPCLAPFSFDIFLFEL